MSNHAHAFPEQMIAVDPVLQYFDYAHLAAELQVISTLFTNTAQGIVELIPRSPERTVALRKLLESKDAAVRAALPAPGSPG